MSDAAIVYDTVSNATETTGTSLTWSHTIGTGQNRLLVVFAGIPTSDTITGVTFNGVACTFVNKAFVPSNRYVYMYYLLNPSSGAHDIVISSSASHLLRGMATSYANVKQIAQPDSSNTNTGTSVGGITLSTTVVATGCWLVGTARGTTTNITGGAGTTVRYTDGDGDGIGDSNAAVSTGSQSLIFNGGASQNYAGVVASFAPITSTTNHLSNYRRGSSKV